VVPVPVPLLPKTFDPGEPRVNNGWTGSRRHQCGRGARRVV